MLKKLFVLQHIDEQKERAIPVHIDQLCNYHENVLAMTGSPSLMMATEQSLLISIEEILYLHCC